MGSFATSQPSPDASIASPTVAGGRSSTAPSPCQGVSRTENIEPESVSPADMLPPSFWMGGPARCGACRSPGRIPGGDATLAGQAGSRTGGPTCSGLRVLVLDLWLAASIEASPREGTAQVRRHLLVRVDALNPILLVVLPVEEGDLVGPAVALLTSRELLDVDVAFHIHRELRLAAVVDDDIRPAAEVPAVESPIRDCLPSETACELHPVVAFVSGPAGARRHSALLWIWVAPPDAGPVAATAASPEGVREWPGKPAPARTVG